MKSKAKAKATKRTDAHRALEAAAREARRETYELCLYIAGTTPRSTAAMTTITALCEERLPGRYELVVVDLYQEPARAKADDIIVAPTLLRRRPGPLRRLVGDLSNRARLLAGLNLPPDLARGHEDEEAAEEESDA